MHVYSHLLFLFAGVLFTLAALAWGYRSTSACGRALSLFLVAESLTCFSYAMNLSADTLSSKLLWKHMEYLFGMPVAPLMPVLALRVTDYEKRLPTWTSACLFAVPAAGIVLHWTNKWHGLLYTRTWMETLDGVSVLAQTHGALYPFLFADMYALIFTACVIFAVRHMRYKIPSPRQTGLMAAALVAPLLFGLPHYWPWGTWSPHINTVHIGFFVTALFLSAVLFDGNFADTVRALDKSERRNRLLLANANVIFYTIKPDGHFSYVSDSVQQFLGYRADEFIGRSYSVFVFPDDIPAYATFLARVVQTGALQSGVEYRVCHADGTLRWNMSSIMPTRNKRNGSTVYVGVAHDITSVKQTQEKLHIANGQLRHLITSRDTELREAVRKALAASDDEAQRIGKAIHDGLCQELVALFRMAENAESADGPRRDQSQQPSAMISQILHALRLARGVAYDLSLCDLDGQTLEDALVTFAKRFETVSGSVIEVNCNTDPSIFNRAETGHIYRVVREASVNAIRHGNAQHIWINLIQESGQVVIAVTNDGTVLPADGPAVQTEGLGLRQIKMRARLLGGTFVLKRTAQGKTLAELVVPRRN